MLTPALALGAALIMSVTPKPPAADHKAQTDAWHQKRLKALTSEDGWLTLVGLFWLEDGANAAGSAEEAAVRFPAPAPAQLGTFTRKGMDVSFTAAPGVGVTRGGQPFPGGALKTDAAGEPDVLSHGSFRFHVIVRGERVGVRLKDVEAKARREFHGIPRYPVDARWRVQAKLVPSPQQKKLAVPNVLGTVEELTSPGVLVFTLDGQEHRLFPVAEPGDKQLFIIFGDATNRTETYGAGRFLYADAPAKDGTVVLDFNRAYNPPCAFSPYATCPLPPRENRLGVAVQAGEKRYGDH